jgi:NitT/TauT family transport system permease protein
MSQIEQALDGMSARSRVSGDEVRRHSVRWKLVADRALDVLLPVVAVAAVLGFWQFYVIWQKVPPFLFPRLDDTLNSLWTNRGDLGSSLLTTLEEAGMGFVFANILAIGGATMFVHSRLAERSMFPLAVLIQTIPIVVWSPILVIIMPNDSMWPQVIISFLITFFPALVNMTQGLRMVDQIHLDLFRMLNASRLQIFLKLRWPASIPSLLASLRITSTLSLVGAIVGDYVAGGGNNLGNLLNRAHQSYDTALMMAVVLVATITGIIIFLAMSSLERIVLGRRG